MVGGASQEASGPSRPKCSVLSISIKFNHAAQRGFVLTLTAVWVIYTFICCDKRNKPTSGVRASTLHAQTQCVYVGFYNTALMSNDGIVPP